MLFECPNCKTRYQESGDLLGLHGYQVKCARCDKVFVARDVASLPVDPPGQAVVFDDETQADPDQVEFDDLTVSDGSAGPVRFDDPTRADSGGVDFEDRTTVDRPEDFLDEPVTQLADKPEFEDLTGRLEPGSPVEFDDTTDPEMTEETKLPVPPVRDFSGLPDLSSRPGIFDDHTNPGVVKAKPAPEKPPDTIIPEIDPDLFEDQTRHATPSRELLQKALPDLIEVDRGATEEPDDGDGDGSEEKTRPE